MQTVCLYQKISVSDVRDGGAAMCRSAVGSLEGTMEFFSQWKERYSLSLDGQQEQAVQAVDGPVLLLAVPGSGKTTVLVSRVGYLCLARGIPPEQILTMTYTVAAALDMRARFAALFGEEAAERLEFRTINGVCSQIIRTYERRLGRTAFDLWEDAGQRGHFWESCTGYRRESLQPRAR